MIKIFFFLFYQEAKGLLRRRGEWTQSILFFVVFVSLFGISVGFANTLLVRMTPAILWVAFLLTTLFTLEALFRDDVESGAVEQLCLSPYPLWWLLFAKSLAYWCVAIVPLLILTPVVGGMLGLSLSSSLTLLLSLAVGSPALSFLAVIGATLTMTIPRAGLLLGSVLFPLYVPVLILGVSAGLSSIESTWPGFELSMLSALSVLSMTLAPHAAAGAMKAGLNS